VASKDERDIWVLTMMRGIIVVVVVVVVVVVGKEPLVIHVDANDTP